MENLTLIIPAKNESESLPIFLNELKKYNCKKMIVLQKDDLKTIESLKDYNEVEIFEQNQLGYGSAIIEGINNTKTEYFCIINADGSMDPKYLPLMLDKCKNCDLVFTSRYLRPGGGSDDDGVVHRAGVAKRLHQLRDGRTLLADGHVDAKERFGCSKRK